MTKKSINYPTRFWKLAKNSNVSPQNVYNSFTNRLQHKLNFIARTTPNSASLLREAKKIIDKKIILLMLKHASFYGKNRKVFSLPVNYVGLSILLPEDRANKFEGSNGICEPLQNQNAFDAEFHQERIFQKIRKKCRSRFKQKRWRSKISLMKKKLIL